MPRVTIITVISGNDIAFMSDCLLSLIMHTDYENVEIIVVCDASTATKNFLNTVANSHPKVRTVFRGYKSGNAANRNLGAASADKETDYLLFTDSDVIYSDSNWLSKLVSILEEQKDVGIAGSGSSTVLGHYCWIQPQSGLVVSNVMDFEGVVPEQPVEMMVIPGYNMLIRHSLFGEIGGWDEGFFPVYGEDIDLCLRCILRGYKIVSRHNPGVVHCYRDTNRNNSCERLSEDSRLWLTVASCRRLALKYANRLPSKPAASFSEWLELVKAMRNDNLQNWYSFPVLPPTVDKGKIHQLFLPMQDTDAIKAIYESLYFDY